MKMVYALQLTFSLASSNGTTVSELTLSCFSLLILTKILVAIFRFYFQLTINFIVLCLVHIQPAVCTAVSSMLS